MEFFKNNKIIILAAVILVLLVGLLIAVWLLSDQGGENTGLMIPSTDGETVQVNDFISTSEQDYAEVTVFLQSDNYVVQYDKVNNVFQIALTVFSQEELNPLRQQAELALISKLGITTEEFCKLDVIETVPDNGVVELTHYTFRPLICSQR